MEPQVPVVTEPTTEVEVKPEATASTNTTTSNTSTEVAKAANDTKGKGLPKSGEAVSTTMVLTAALGSMAGGIRLRRKSKDN